MDVFSGQHPLRKLVAGEDILAFQVGKLHQQILHRIAAGEVFEKGLHRIAKAPYAWLPMTNVRVNRDAGKKVFVSHGCILRPQEIQTKHAGSVNRPRIWPQFVMIQPQLGLDRISAFYPCNPCPSVVEFLSCATQDITQDIIGAAMVVLNELKPGLDEKLYEKALVIELQSMGHVVEQQREFPVYYRRSTHRHAHSRPDAWMVKSSPIRRL